MTFLFLDVKKYYYCNPVLTGQYVVIRKQITGSLTIAEIIVWGPYYGKLLSNLILLDI